MHQEGLIDPAAQSENGSTFANVFGSGKVGIMGTGQLQRRPGQAAEPEHRPGRDAPSRPRVGLGLSFAGGDIVAIPKGSKRLKDAVDFEKFILSDTAQVEVYSKAGNLTTRSDMADNTYTRADPFNADLAKALPSPRTPYALKFFEEANSRKAPGCRCSSASITPMTISTRSLETPREDMRTLPVSEMTDGQMSDVRRVGAGKESSPEKLDKSPSPVLASQTQPRSGGRRGKRGTPWGWCSTPDVK